MLVSLPKALVRVTLHHAREGVRGCWAMARPLLTCPNRPGSRCGPSVPRASRRTVCSAWLLLGEKESDRHQHTALEPAAAASCCQMLPGKQGVSSWHPRPCSALHVATYLPRPLTPYGFRGRPSSRSESSEEGSGLGPGTLPVSFCAKRICPENMHVPSCLVSPFPSRRSFSSFPLSQILPRGVPWAVPQ